MSENKPSYEDLSIELCSAIEQIICAQNSIDSYQKAIRVILDNETLSQETKDKIEPFLRAGQENIMKGLVLSMSSSGVSIQ